MELTLEKAEEITLSCKTRAELIAKHPKVYYYAVFVKMLDIWIPHKKAKWTKESVVEEGKKHVSSSEFKKHAIGAYRYALRHGLIRSIFPKASKVSLRNERIDQLEKQIENLSTQNYTLEKQVEGLLIEQNYTLDKLHALEYKVFGADYLLDRILPEKQS